MGFAGFPRRVRHIPVPSPVFGPLLEEIDDLAELKCTLRVIWLLHQKRGFPRFITLGELMADRILARGLATEGSSHADRLKRALSQAVERGTLVTGTADMHGNAEQLYALNTEADRRALAKVIDEAPPTDSIQTEEPWEAPAERPNVFALYEDNIGMLSPMIAEELREAEELYPAAWIEEAVREAVGLNRRNWRYVSRILERWEREGRGDGESGRHTKKAGYY